MNILFLLLQSSLYWTQQFVALIFTAERQLWQLPARYPPGHNT